MRILCMLAALLLAFVAFESQAQTTDTQGRPITIRTADKDTFPDANGQYTVRYLSPSDEVDLEYLCLYRMDTGLQLPDQCIRIPAQGGLRVSWVSDFGLGELSSDIQLRATAIDLAGNESIKGEYAAILKPAFVPPDPEPDPAPAAPTLLEP